MIPGAAPRRLSRHQSFDLSFLLLTARRHPQFSPMLTKKHPTVCALHVLLDREAVKIRSAGRKSQGCKIRVCVSEKSAGSPFVSA